LNANRARSGKRALNKKNIFYFQAAEGKDLITTEYRRVDALGKNGPKSRRWSREYIGLVSRSSSPELTEIADYYFFQFPFAWDFPMHLTRLKGLATPIGLREVTS
jgi:hypothetical protein